MTKKTFIIIAAHIALVAVTNLLFFLLLKTPVVNEWIAWGFIHLSIAISAATYIISVKKSELRALRIGLFALGAVYCAVTIVSSVIYIALFRSLAASLMDKTNNSISIESLFPVPLCIATFAFFLFCFAIFVTLDVVLTFAVYTDDK